MRRQAGNSHEQDIKVCCDYSRHIGNGGVAAIRLC